MAKVRAHLDTAPERGCVPLGAGSAAATWEGRTGSEYRSASGWTQPLRLVSATQPRSGGSAEIRPTPYENTERRCLLQRQTATFPDMKPRPIQPLLRVVLALLGVCLVASPQSAKATSYEMPDHSWTVKVGNNTYGLEGMGTGTADAWTVLRLGNHRQYRVWKMDFRTVATAIIVPLLLAVFGVFALLSSSLRSKPKLTEHVQAP